MFQFEMPEVPEGWETPTLVEYVETLDLTSLAAEVIETKEPRRIRIIRAPFLKATSEREALQMIQDRLPSGWMVVVNPERRSFQGELWYSSRGEPPYGYNIFQHRE